MGTEFDDDTSLRRTDDGTWTATVADRWHVGAGANGGFMASYPLRAMLDIAPFPDPLAMTTHYVQRPTYGPATVQATVTHAGKAHAFLHASMAQDHGVVLTAMAVFGTHRGEGETTLVTGRPPSIPPPDDCPVLRSPTSGMPFVERFEYRIPADDAEAFWAPTPAPARVYGWARLVDRHLDTTAVPLFMDCFPPAVFGAVGLGLAPTLELSVHFRSRPRTSWHLAEFRTRFLVGGYMEEDGELWDEDGTLVAQSRQLARFTPAPPG